MPDLLERVRRLLFDPEQATQLPRYLLRPARYGFVLLRDLAEGQLSMRAMSLVYTTLLSLVPMLALGFSVLKALGVHNSLEPVLLEALAPLGTDPDKGFLEVAPVLIAIFAQKRGGPRPGDARKNYYVTESVGIATGLLIAALHKAGLATLTHTPAPMSFLSEICGRPAEEKPFLLLVAGHPADNATVPLAALDKKPLDAIAAWI